MLWNPTSHPRTATSRSSCQSLRRASWWGSISSAGRPLRRWSPKEPATPRPSPRPSPADAGGLGSPHLLPPTSTAATALWTGALGTGLSLDCRNRREPGLGSLGGELVYWEEGCLYVPIYFLHYFFLKCWWATNVRGMFILWNVSINSKQLHMQVPVHIKATALLYITFRWEKKWN